MSSRAAWLRPQLGMLPALPRELFKQTGSMAVAIQHPLVGSEWGHGPLVLGRKGDYSTRNVPQPWTHVPACIGIHLAHPPFSKKTLPLLTAKAWG